MVFISFPTNTTSEEENLIKKYEKLDKKRKSLEQAEKPEPEIVSKNFDKPIEAKDAKKVIERLKKKGALPQISSGRKQEFKRKASQYVVPKKVVKVEEEEEEQICYDDVFE